MGKAKNLTAEPEHSPGPWHAVQYANWFNLQRSPDYAKDDIFDIENYHNAGANATLAASAPDLYEACKHNIEFHEWLALRIRDLPEDVQQDIGEAGGDAATYAIVAMERAEGKS